MLNTEKRNPKTMHIDEMEIIDMVKILNEENMVAVEAVAKASDAIAAAATAAAEPPEEPPGTCSVFQGFLVAPNADVSDVEPMANSSMLVFPRIIAPAFCRLITASAL
jgi:hypothetical protein